MSAWQSSDTRIITTSHARPWRLTVGTSIGIAGLVFIAEGVFWVGDRNWIVRRRDQVLDLFFVKSLGVSAIGFEFVGDSEG
jgi:hypothetical protein